MIKTAKPVSSIATLIDDLKADEVNKRIYSIKNLPLIASALGPERTRLELLPFINELLDDEDEVLLHLSGSLGHLTDYVGGNSFAHILINPLEKLCYIDDSTIREKAAQSIKKVASLIDFKKHEDLIVQFVKKLVNSSSTAAKEASCTIIPGIFPLVSSSQVQNELIQSYSKMCNDTSAEVRKFASMNLKDLVQFLNSSNEGDLLNCIRTLLKDNQDFVKLYIVDTLAVLGQVANPQKNQANLIIFLKVIAEDPSWRVRYTVAEKIGELGQSLGKQQSKAILLPYVVKFLQDTEPELKTITSLRLAKFAEHLDETDIVQKIVPCLNNLAKDPLEHVRAALSESILSLCPVVGKKGTNDYILQIFLMLLRDDSSEVRVNLFKNLDDLTKVIDIESLSQSLLPALNELATDKKWRTRSSAIEFLPFFAKKIGEDFLNERFTKLLLDCLMDKVYSVRFKNLPSIQAYSIFNREVGIQCVKELIQQLGSPWAERQLFPKLQVLQTSQTYLYRITMLYIVQQSVELLTPETLSRIIPSILVPLSKDGVPNVRMNATKAFKVVIPLMKDKSGDVCKKALTQMTEDVDPDVKYLARVALGL